MFGCHIPTTRLCRWLLWLLPLVGVCTAEAQDTTIVATDHIATTPRAALRHQRAAVTLRTGVSNDATIRVVTAAGDTIALAPTATPDDSLALLSAVEVLLPKSQQADNNIVNRFNPDPKRALWLSVLCPGLGQIYNRRYWKLPIIVGAFVGLSYGTAWNNRMLTDYSRAYRDITDKDPDTRSYMNFYPPNTDEASLNKEWLTNALKSKRNYYRRYRDICIFSMIGVYALCIIDAYVDASLAHFDISPDLSMRIKPAVINPANSPTLQLPALGLQCAVNF